jgi:PadR family transcriptional regulator AphA
VPSTPPTPTTTNHALLGLLAVRQWTAYELTAQMRRSLSFIWPRAESKVYESMKRLEDLGLARSRKQSNGQRQRTVYRISARGRRALADWLASPGAGPSVEFEAAVKLFFADSASRDAVLANLDAIRDWVTRTQSFGAQLAAEYVDSDGGPYPQRLHINALINEYIWRHSEMTREWVEWATAQVRDWRGTGPQPHRKDTDLATYRRVLAAARS